MNNSRYKIIFLVFSVITVFLFLIYFAVFGRALNQREDHIAITFALPRLIFSSEAIRIDDQTYLAKDIDSFIKLMGDQGFAHIEQLGSGYIFKKDGKLYISTSRMYSSHFMIFTYPKEN